MNSFEFDLVGQFCIMEEMINPLYLIFWQLKGFYSFNYASIESGILIRNVHSAGDSGIVIMVASSSFNLLRYESSTLILY